MHFRSHRFLTWYLERRRRRRRAAANSIPAPLITNGWAAWGDTDPAWADNYISIQFDAASFPGGTFEIWERDSLHVTSRLLGTIASQGLVDYQHVQASAIPDTCFYKVRYVNSAAGSPFSLEYAVVVELP